MNREDAKALYEIYERALAVLSEAEPVLRALPEGEEKSQYWQAHGRIIVDILSKLRAPIVIQYRDLDTDRPKGPPDTLLDPDELEAVDRLTPAVIQRIDDALLADCASTWRKVARIVGTAMMQLSKELPDVPDGFYGTRVIALVNEGRLESQGNLDYMRYSEVRLRS